jgi:hypothetical protein
MNKAVDEAFIMWRDRAEKAEAEVTKLRAALQEIKKMGEGKISSLPLLAWRRAADALGELRDHEQETP